MRISFRLHHFTKKVSYNQPNPSCTHCFAAFTRKPSRSGIRSLPQAGNAFSDARHDGLPLDDPKGLTATFAGEEVESAIEPLLMGLRSSFEGSRAIDRAVADVFDSIAGAVADARGISNAVFERMAAAVSSAVTTFMLSYILFGT